MSENNQMLQEAFNIIYIGAAKQNFVRSVDKTLYYCRYVGDNNTKCHIGHLIPDAEYTPKLEGKEFSISKDLQKILIKYKDYFELLTELQHLHDTDINNNTQEDLIKFAQKYNLTIPSY